MLHLLSPRLCFFIVLNRDLFVHRDDSFTSYLGLSCEPNNQLNETYGPFVRFVVPIERKTGLLSGVRDMSWGFGNHVLLSLLWSEFGKKTVNYVTHKF